MMPEPDHKKPLAVLSLENDGEYLDHERRLYGRRKGAPLSPQRQALYQNMLAQTRLDPRMFEERVTQDTLAQLFSFAPKGYGLEIGFGAGEHLLHIADSHEDWGWIGCEPFINGMANLLAGMKAQKLNNIRVYDDDASLLLAQLPDATLDRIYLLYPDPWHKKRHWKRRFVCAQNLSQIIRILKPGGLFYFASDHADYVTWTQAQCAHYDVLLPIHHAHDECWPQWRQTRYEQKALKAGRKPSYHIYQRQSAKA